MSVFPNITMEALNLRITITPEMYIKKEINSN